MLTKTVLSQIAGEEMLTKSVRRGDSKQRKNEHDGGAGLTNIMGMAQRNNENDGGAGLASIILWLQTGIMLWMQTVIMLWMQTGLAWLMVKA